MLRRLKSLRKPLAIICIAGLVVSASAIGLWFLRDAAALRYVEDTRNQLRAEGLAVDFDDLLDAPPSDEENAAPLYEAVFKQLEAEQARIIEEGDEGFEIRDPWHLEESVAAKLVRYEPLEELLRRATARPRCAFTIEYNGMGTPLPHIAGLRQALDFIVARTAERARAGDLGAAFDGAWLAARVARALEEDPHWVSQMTRLAKSAQVLGALEVLLPLADDPVGVLQRVAPDTCRGAAWRGLRADLVAMLDTAGKDVAEMARFFDEPRPSFSFRLKAPVFRSDLASTATLIARALEAEDLPYAEQLLVKEEILSDLNRAPDLVVTKFMLPVALGSIEQEARHASRVAMARLAAELLAFRRRTGAFPEALEALGLDRTVTIDPYTEMPFRLLRRDEGTWIASDAAPLDDEEDVKWVLEDEEGEFAWARWRVDAPLPPRSRPREKEGVQMLEGIAESLGIRVSRRGLTEEEWFEKVKAKVEAAGVGIQFGPDDAKAK